MSNRPYGTKSVRSSIMKFILLMVVSAGAVWISACSTTEGFGEDVKHLGGNIEDSAERNK